MSDEKSQSDVALEAFDMLVEQGKSLIADNPEAAAFSAQVRTKYAEDFPALLLGTVAQYNEMVAEAYNAGIEQGIGVGFDKTVEELEKRVKANGGDPDVLFQCEDPECSCHKPAEVTEES